MKINDSRYDSHFKNYAFIYYYSHKKMFFKIK